MKTHTIALVSIAALAGVAMPALGAPALDAKAADRRAEMEKCFREHGKFMSKPALTNPYDCWRAHAYLMTRQW